MNILMFAPDDFDFPLLTLSTIAVIGYWFRSFWNYTKFSMMRESGYHLLYNSVLAGFIIAISLYLLYLALGKLFIASNFSWFFESDEAAIYITIIFGIFLPFLLNSTLFYSKHKCLRCTAESYGDSLYLIIFEAYESESLIELTLKNGKIFIGFVPKPLNFRYKYIDITLQNSSHQIAITVDEVLTAKHVDRQDFEQVRSGDN